MHWAHWNGAWTELINIPSPYEAGAKRGVQYALGRNFGELEFDWDNQRVIVRILDDRTNGKGVLSTAWDFDVLSGSVPSPILRGSAPSDFEQTREGLLTHGASLDDWICVNHGGSPTLALKLFGVASPISVVVVIILLPFIFSVLAGGAIYRQRARRWQNYRHIHKVKSQ